MSDETAENAPNPEVQARELGWEPKEEFKGNPEKWVSAEEYLKRGETILPYMQADRKRLFRKVDEQGAELQRLRSQLAESTESITVLKQFATTDALEKKDKEIAGLRRQLAEARRNGTPEQEVELEAELDAARDKRAELAAQAKPVNGSGGNGADSGNSTQERVRNLTETPEFQAFLRDNPWYNSDSVARAAATAISGEIMQDPANRSLSFADKLALVAEQTKARMGIGASARRGNSKVEGSRGGGDGGGRQSSGPSYDALPPEAKAICDRQEKMFVGPGKRYKTQAEWRKAYAEKVS